MTESDCYAVLGLSRDATLSQIRRAYRELCHRFDPDHAGPSAAGTFNHVNHAFDALSHTASRADHDRELMAREQDLSSETPEPLLPPRHLLDDYDHHRPSKDELSRALLADGTGWLPKSRPVHPIHVDVVLDDAQAAQGGTVPFDVPAANLCDVCDGSGRTGYFRCDICDGHGVHWTVGRVDVVIPRNAPAGMTLPVSLQSLGISTLFLNVTLRRAISH